MKVFLYLVLLINLVYSASCLNKEKYCKCRILPKSKIIGGKQAHHLAYPWIISLSRLKDDNTDFDKSFLSEDIKINFHSCGGSIINKYWILTAAHCLPQHGNQSVYIGYGNDNDLVKIFDFGRIESIKLVTNSNYNKGTLFRKTENDIALVKLKKPIQFSNYVKPACFLNENEKIYSGFLDHAGWGYTEVFKVNLETGEYSNSKIPRSLKEIFLVDQSDTFRDCKVNLNIVCAKGMESGESSCKGDSGSPVHYTKNGKSYVIGITSYTADPYTKDNYYHVCVGTTAYTRISSYMDWIKKYVKNDICDF